MEMPSPPHAPPPAGDNVELTREQGIHGNYRFLNLTRMPFIPLTEGDKGGGKSEIVNRSTELTTKSKILALSLFGSGLSGLGVFMVSLLKKYTLNSIFIGIINF